VADRCAVIGIEPGAVEVDAAAETDRPAGDVAGLADEVDHRAGRVAGEGRRRSAAQHLDALDVVIGAQEGVGGGEGDVAEIEHRQAVFLELDELGPAAGGGQAAHRDIGIGLAARRFRSQAGNVAQQIGAAERREPGEVGGIDRADRDAGGQPAPWPRRPGDDDVLVGRRGLVSRCRRGGCRGFGYRHGGLRRSTLRNQRDRSHTDQQTGRNVHSNTSCDAETSFGRINYRGGGRRRSGTGRAQNCARSASDADAVGIAGAIGCD
jgi:hypothetical protein